MHLYFTVGIADEIHSRFVEPNTVKGCFFLRQKWIAAHQREVLGTTDR